MTARSRSDAAALVGPARRRARAVRCDGDRSPERHVMTLRRPPRYLRTTVKVSVFGFAAPAAFAAFTTAR